MAVIECRFEPESFFEWCRHNQRELWALLPQNSAPRRQYSWLLSRILLGSLMGTFNVAYQDGKKPYIVGRQEKISLSHSGQAAALWISDHRCGGIDIQQVDERLLGAGQHFLSTEQYLMVLSQSSDAERIQLLLKAWTLKEAIVKASSQTSLNYSQHILFTSNEWKTASVHTILEVAPSALYCWRVMHFCNAKYHLSFTV